MKRTLAFLILTLALTSCGGDKDPRTETYGKAIAETTCLIIDETIPADQAEKISMQIWDTYEIEDPSVIEPYIESIAGTATMNEMSVLVREHLEETCSEALEAIGTTPAEMAEALVVTN